MKMKLVGVLVLVLTVTCGLGSCSFFDGKKKPKPYDLGPSSGPVLGRDGINLGG